MQQIKLNKLHCHLNDEADSDEIYLKVNNSKIWPLGFFKSVDSGDIKIIDVTMKHDDDAKPALIEIWDYDFLSRNDLIGTFELMAGSKKKGQFQSTIKASEGHSTAAYLLDWEIL